MNSWVYHIKYHQIICIYIYYKDKISWNKVRKWMNRSIHSKKYWSEIDTVRIYIENEQKKNSARHLVWSCGFSTEKVSLWRGYWEGLCPLPTTLSPLGSSLFPVSDFWIHPLLDEGCFLRIWTSKAMKTMEDWTCWSWQYYVEEIQGKAKPQDTTSRFRFQTLET